MSAIDELLTCTVCLHWFNSPRCLPCHHVYCLECIASLFEDDSDYIHCPECGHRHAFSRKRLGDLPTDTRLSQFIEKQRKCCGERCRDCRNVCQCSVEYSMQCEHCQLPFCDECQPQHNIQLFELLQQRSSNFSNTFLTDAKMRSIRSHKADLTRQKASIEAVRDSVMKELDSISAEVEKRRHCLLTCINAKESLIEMKLARIELAEKTLKCDGNQIQSASVIDVSKSNIVIADLLSVNNEINERMRLMWYLQTIVLKKEIISVLFKTDLDLRRMIDEYGDFVTAIDYKKDLDILNTTNGEESDTDMVYPYGLTVCPYNDTVYVTDDASIRLYDSDGKFMSKYVTNDQPRGLAFDGQRRIIVTSLRDNNVKIYSHNMRFLKSFGSRGVSIGQFCIPFGVVCDKNDNIYVVDRVNHRIQAFTSAGMFLSMIGVDILKGPYYIQINERQELLVTDYFLGNVEIFSLDGMHLRSLLLDGDTKLQGPIGLCLDVRGFILVADNKGKKIEIFTSEGTHYTTISEPGDALRTMYGITATLSRVIFTTDWADNKIYVIG